MKTRKHVNDIFLAAAILILAAALFFLISALKSPGAKAVITSDGTVFYELPLNKDVSVTVEGPHSFNTVTVKDGEIYIESAGCPDQLCVNMGHIDDSGETVICLPNKLVIEITGSGEIDVVT